MSEPTVTATTIENELVQQGFSRPVAVESFTLPSDFSGIPDFGDNNIGEVMGRVSADISFLEYKVSLASIDYENWNNHYEMEKKKILLTLPQERRDLMEAKVEVQLEAVINVVSQKKAMFNLLKSLLDGKKRISDALSRDLSRRSLIHQMQSR